MITGQTLLFDADDTLWQNNRLFEDVITDFVKWLDHPVLDESEIRTVLHEVETANVARRGYGTRAFAANLRDVVNQVSKDACSRDVSVEEAIERLLQRLSWTEVELIADVQSTLADLQERHELVLVTKGDQREQKLKIEVSGLRSYFSDILIVHEKDAATYRRLINQLNLDVDRTWMIGDSPRSDVIAPVEAGLRSVYVPHRWTRRFELAEVPEHPNILRVARFGELRDHF